MGSNKGTPKHEKEGFVWDAPAKGGAVVISLMLAGLVAGVLNKKNGSESSATTVSIVTENMKPVTQEDELTSRHKRNEEIFAMFQEKIQKDSNYTPTRTERIVLAQLGIAVNDGAPIPYDGDGNKE